MTACLKMIEDMAISQARCDPNHLEKLEIELKRREYQPPPQEEIIAMEMQLTEEDNG